MNFIDENKVPVEINDRELPRDDGMNQQLFNEEISDKNNEGGFVSGIFLFAIMVTCFMLGMIAVIAVR